MTDEYSLEMDRERQRLAETMAAETELMIRKAERGQWTESAEMRTKSAEIEDG